MFLKPVFFRMWCGRMEKSRVDRSASWDLASKETATVALLFHLQYDATILVISLDSLGRCCPLVVDPFTFFGLLAGIAVATFLLR